MPGNPVKRRASERRGSPLRITSGHFLDDLVSAFFPRTCPLCRRRIREPGAGFCVPCTSSFSFIRPPFCIDCGAPLSAHREGTPVRCISCLIRPPSPRERRPTVRSAALHTGTLRDALLGVKFAGRTDTAHSLGLLLRDRYPDSFGSDLFDLVLPMPLHVRRLRQRGFNPCDFLARPLARELGLPVDRGSVARTRDTPPQRGTGRRQRRRNLAGAFAVNDPARVRGRSILILDDVYTTGATVEALSRALISAGAVRVAAYTLTRTPGGSDARAPGSSPSRRSHTAQPTP